MEGTAQNGLGCIEFSRWAVDFYVDGGAVFYLVLGPKSVLLKPCCIVWGKRGFDGLHLLTS